MKKNSVDRRSFFAYRAGFEGFSRPEEPLVPMANAHGCAFSENPGLVAVTQHLIFKCWVKILPIGSPTIGRPTRGRDAEGCKANPARLNKKKTPSVDGVFLLTVRDQELFFRIFSSVSFFSRASFTAASSSSMAFISGASRSTMDSRRSANVR